MIVINRGGSLIQLEEDGRWYGPHDDPIVQEMNRATELERGQLSPADGHPRRAITSKMVERYGGRVIVDDEEDGDPDVEY